MDLLHRAEKTIQPIFARAQKELRQRTAMRDLRHYIREGRIPWTNGYTVYRREAIIRALWDERLLRAFAQDESLPGGYGVGIDERCVEIPWIVVRIGDRAGPLLDAGSALNHDFILDHPAFLQKKIHIMTLAPEANCFWKKGISYLFCDLRDIPIREGYYDVIACVSTLEHVGSDNRAFTQNQAYQENRPEDFSLVLQELRRVLKPGGVLLFTVPFGIYRHFGWFQQYDSNLLHSAINAFGGGAGIGTVFYRYTVEGWNVADEADCAGSEYVQWVSRPPDQWYPPDEPEPDLAAAARAVACVELVKG